MESMAINGSHNGAQDKEAYGNGSGRPPASSARLCVCDGVLRIFAIAAALVATVVMGTAKETQTVEIQIVSTLPPLPVPVTAKSSYSSAFVYFVVANAIAMVYSATSLFWSGVMARTRSSSLRLSTAAFDVAMVALLFSANGAAMAFGIVGKYGNKHVGWTKVCDVFRGFCLRGEIAVAVSFLASLAYLLLALLSIVATHRKLCTLSAT